MAVLEQSAEVTEARFVAECLEHFAADPTNRDIALARCLYYLQRLNAIGTALEGAMPQIGALADNPLLKRLMPGGR